MSKLVVSNEKVGVNFEPESQTNHKYKGLR
jgi:hypothetical protein